jgi:hypothetical protein
MWELSHLKLRGLQMNQTSKKLSVLLTALTISLSGLTAAQAAEPTYSYSQYIETQGYKNLQAAAAASTAKISAASGVNMEFNIKTSSAGQVSNITGTIKATHTAVLRSSTMEGLTSTASFFDGSYFLELKEAATELGANNSSIVKRLPSSAIKYVKLGKLPNEGSTLSDLNPNYIFNGEFNSSLTSSILNMDTTSFTFGDVTTSPNDLVPTSTDYKNKMTMTDAQTGMSADVQSTQTFNAEGVLTDTSINETISFLGMAILAEIKLTQTIDNTLVLTAPETATVMTSANFIALDKQISAEASQKPNANKILAKAKTLAKSGKKALSASHLLDAAKALKIKVKPVPNGIKLAGTYKGVTGNLCVTAVKGAAITKNC